MKSARLISHLLAPIHTFGPIGAERNSRTLAAVFARCSFMRVRAHKVKILLADSNLMNCRLLSHALQRNPDFAVVGIVDELEHLTPAMDELSPEVVLVSSHLISSAHDHFLALRAVTASHPDVPCILLADQSGRDTVVGAFRAGVKGIFSCCEGDTKVLEKCIKRVMEGQIWANSTQLHFVIAALPELRVPQPRSPGVSRTLLTTREQQVVRLVAEGMGNRDIALHMQLSENTVKNYLFRIFEKLGFSNRVELVLYATRHETNLAGPDTADLRETDRLHSRSEVDRPSTGRDTAGALWGSAARD